MSIENELVAADMAVIAVYVVVCGIIVASAISWLFSRKPDSIDITVDWSHIPSHHKVQVQRLVAALNLAYKNGAEVCLIEYMLSSGELRGQRDVLLGNYLPKKHPYTTSTVDMGILYGKYINVARIYK